MGRKSKNDVEEKIKLISNFWKILAMCGASCFFTILLAIVTGLIKGMIVLKIFLYAMMLVLAIFSIITMVTTCATIYFKITTLDEEKFKEAVCDAISDFNDI